MVVYSSGEDDLPATSISDKCIILDLDHTLISTADTMNELYNLRIMKDPRLVSFRKRIYILSADDPMTQIGQGEKFEFWGVKRPHLEEFLIFCFSFFRKVGVWSAGKRTYVEAIVDEIFKTIKSPDIVYTYDDCDNGIHQITKPIRKMMEDPLVNGIMTLKNTFIVDDLISTFISVNPDNGILIPEYKPPITLSGIATDDNSLLQLKYWFSRPEVLESEDVRLLRKDTIFSEN